MQPKPQLVELNCGFWYWHNEYGKPSCDPGTEHMTPMFGITFHLNGVGSHQGRSAVSIDGRRIVEPAADTLPASLLKT
jgi:hypothetical protein